MKHNILYSFRRCPYAIIARWALLNTNQVVELREVELKNKPIELIQISKKATVPVLKTSLNKVIDESLEIMIWSIKRSNMHELFGDKNNDISKEILSPGYDKRNYNQICHLPFSFVSRNRYCFTKTKGRKTIK